MLKYETETAEWIINSTKTLNKTLIKVAKLEEEFFQRTPRGWEYIDGKWTFTGKRFCEDVTCAYGIVLLKLFPDTKDLETVYLKLPDMSHVALSYTLASKRYILDGTYGQVPKVSNQILIAPITELPNLYPTNLADPFSIPFYPPGLGVNSHTINPEKEQLMLSHDGIRLPEFLVRALIAQSPL